MPKYLTICQALIDKQATVCYAKLYTLMSRQEPEKLDECLMPICAVRSCGILCLEIVDLYSK